jgi:NADH:ubiquinone oxidoreductase subunit K
MLGIFVTRKNIIVILMSIELMLLAINVNFIVYSVYLDDFAWSNFCFVCFDGCCCGVGSGFSYFGCVLPC